MNIAEMAKVYNECSKIFSKSSCMVSDEKKLIYKANNKLYFMDEKQKSCKLVYEIDSKHLELFEDFKENVIFALSFYPNLNPHNPNKESESDMIFFDCMLVEIDRQSLLENDFFAYCINDIEKDNKVCFLNEDTQKEQELDLLQTEQTESKPQQIGEHDKNESEELEAIAMHMVKVMCKNMVSNAKIEKHLTKEVGFLDKMQEAYMLMLPYLQCNLIKQHSAILEKGLFLIARRGQSPPLRRIEQKRRASTHPRPPPRSVCIF